MKELGSAVTPFYLDRNYRSAACSRSISVYRNYHWPMEQSRARFANQHLN